MKFKLSKGQRVNIRYNSYIGKTFGNIIITSIEGFKLDGDNYKRMFVSGKCLCGKTWTGRLSYLKTGRTKSCGCIHSERMSNLNASHRMKNTPEYRSFKGAKERCNNSKNKDYYNYGGRGIKFLFNSFEEFFEELGFKPTKFHSVDRKNNNGNYEKGNVKWSTGKEQQNNRRI